MFSGSHVTYSGLSEVLLVSSDLQDSKAKLEEAQRIVHIGYWEWDLRSNRVIWSDETYRIYAQNLKSG